MSTLVADDLPEAMADHLAAFGPDLDEAAVVYLLAADPRWRLADLVEHASKAIAIAEMARNSKRDLDAIRADIAREMRR